MSATVRPARLSASGMAKAGPTPITCGGTPATANERSVPRMGMPRRAAAARDMSSVAAAPSDT
jgi:hypothetical protein